MSSRCSPVNPAPVGRVADSGYLLRPPHAVEKVNSGAIQPLVSAGRRQYRVEHSSVLLATN